MAADRFLDHGAEGRIPHSPATASSARHTRVPVATGPLSGTGRRGELLAGLPRRLRPAPAGTWPTGRAVRAARAADGTGTLPGRNLDQPGPVQDRARPATDVVVRRGVPRLSSVPLHLRSPVATAALAALIKAEPDMVTSYDSGPTRSSGRSCWTARSASLAVMSAATGSGLPRAAGVCVGRTAVDIRNGDRFWSNSLIDVIREQAGSQLQPDTWKWYTGELLSPSGPRSPPQDHSIVFIHAHGLPETHCEVVWDASSPNSVCLSGSVGRVRRSCAKEGCIDGRCS